MQGWMCYLHAKRWDWAKTDQNGIMTIVMVMVQLYARPL